MTAMTAKQRTEAAHLLRRPDLSLLERIKLATRLLEEAPGLATMREKRIRLISCEALLRYCVLELELALCTVEESPDALPAIEEELGWGTQS